MPSQLPPTTWEEHRLEWGRYTHVMGILNVTPDSFAGDGLIETNMAREEIVARALAQARSFVEEGAMLLDVGGESTTRPGFASISLEEELARVIPVIQALYAALPGEVIISIDTYKAEVARRALDAGAALINDIWALQRDPEIADLAGERGVPVVVMANMRRVR